MFKARQLTPSLFEGAVAAKSSPGLAMRNMTARQGTSRYLLAVATFHVLQVPRLLYYASCAAFASTFCHNLLSLFYEASPIKKQLALMQCLIKGISALTDLQLGLGDTAVIADSNGTP